MKDSEAVFKNVYTPEEKKTCAHFEVCTIVGSGCGNTVEDPCPYDTTATKANSLEIPEDVMLALDKWAKQEKGRFNSQVMKDLITGKSLAQKILLNAVQKHGVWEPLQKKKLVKG